MQVCKDVLIKDHHETLQEEFQVLLENDKYDGCLFSFQFSKN